MTLLTLDVLRSGSVLRISTREAADLLGCSRFTLERNRVEGKGIPFVKDPETGRVWYTPDAILAHIERGVPCTATVQYDNAAQQERLSKARTVLAERRRNSVARAV